MIVGCFDVKRRRAQPF